MDQIKIGRFVAELRKQKGWTQAQLGEKLGVTNKTVSRWENGNYMPELAVIPELAAALEVSVNELIAGERFAEAEYKRGADEQLLKTMQLIEEIREIKDSRWLSRGFGSMALAIFVAGFVNIVILQTNIGDYQPSNAWILLILAIVIAGVLGIMYLNKGRALLFLSAVLLFKIYIVDEVAFMVMMAFAIPMAAISIISDRMYFRAIDELLVNTQAPVDLLSEAREAKKQEDKLEV